MAHIISFATDAFDPSTEPENPINPIAGHSVLAWLRSGTFAGTFQTSEPDYEDWGWYIEVTGTESPYTVGSICYENRPDHPGDRGCTAIR